MAEKVEEAKEEESWAAKLRQYNSQHKKGETSKSPLEGRGDTEEDRKLLKEYYVKYKGESINRYSQIPKFYSKVLSQMVVA